MIRVIEQLLLRLIMLKLEGPRYHEGQFVDIAFETAKTKEKSTSCSIVHVLRRKNNITNYFVKNNLTIDKDICFYDNLYNFTLTFMRINININPSI